jgi:hypothetical protein
MLHVIVRVNTFPDARIAGTVYYWPNCLATGTITSYEHVLSYTIRASYITLSHNIYYFVVILVLDLLYLVVSIPLTMTA